VSPAVSALQPGFVLTASWWVPPAPFFHSFPSFGSCVGQKCFFCSELGFWGHVILRPRRFARPAGSRILGVLFGHVFPTVELISATTAPSPLLALEKLYSTRQFFTRVSSLSLVRGAFFCTFPLPLICAISGPLAPALFFLGSVLCE